MNDPTNDIDSLLRYLLTSGDNEHWNDDSARWRAALTALVAERNSLKQRVAELKAQNIELHYAMEDRPPADRDLRERLVCAALNGILSEQRGLLNHEYALRAIGLADATLAAMRKGDTNGK